MSKFAKWWVEHDLQILWFLIGWMTWGATDALARGNYILAAFDVAVAYLNYYLWKQRNVD